MGLSIKHDRSQVTPGRLVLIAALCSWLGYLVLGGHDASDLNQETTHEKVTPQVDRGREIAGLQKRSAAWDRLEFSPADLELYDPFARLTDNSVQSQPVDAVADSVEATTPVTDTTSAADRLAQSERLRLQRERFEQAERLRLQREQQLAQRLAIIKNQRIDVVIQSAGKTSALIGRRMIHEGELLEDGIRVLSISPRGMRVAVDDETAAADEQPESPAADTDSADGALR